MDMVAESNWPDLQLEISRLLKRALQIMQAPMGNVQIANWRTGELVIAAQQGFGPDFLSFFQSVTMTDRSVCGIAFPGQKSDCRV